MAGAVAPGCPELSPTFACTISVRTTEGVTRGFVSDPGLSSRLATLQLRGADHRLALQQFFAETAMIREEVPGVPGRVVQATIPSLWQPPPQLARLLLEGVQNAPWIRSVTAQEALEAAAPGGDQPLVERAPPVENLPPEDYFEAIEAAADVVSSYGSVVPPGNERVVRLRRNILVAQSRLLWKDLDAGLAYIESSAEEARAEMAKIGLAGSEDVTLSSRQAPLQLAVLNGTDVPVDVEIHLSSPDLEFDEPVVRDTYPPGARTLTIDTRVKTSGAFPLTVTLETPDGYEIAQKVILIRSTSFNQIALGITVGALAFLVLFYSGKALRRRRVAAEAR